jgi:hypothetical protein
LGGNIAHSELIVDLTNSIAIAPDLTFLAERERQMPMGASARPPVRASGTSGRRPQV